MNAQSEIEPASTEPNGDAAAEVVVRNAGDDMDELLQTIEAELAAQQSGAADDHQLDSWDFEESIRHALEGLSDEARSDALTASVVRPAEPTRDDFGMAAAEAAEPAVPSDEPLL